MANSKSLVTICEKVLKSKADGHETTTVNGVIFDDNIYDGRGGRCQENARKVYEAATGKIMPGRSCCAGMTQYQLSTLVKNGAIKKIPLAEIKPGDYMYFSGGPKCHNCGRPVGHVGIYLSDDRMFQHTSRKGLDGVGLGITAEPPTADQRKRLIAIYRMLPLDGTLDIRDKTGKLLTTGQLIDGKAWAPVRAIAEALGATVVAGDGVVTVRK